MFANHMLTIQENRDKVNFLLRGKSKRQKQQLS